MFVLSFKHMRALLLSTLLISEFITPAAMGQESAPLQQLPTLSEVGNPPKAAPDDGLGKLPASAATTPSSRECKPEVGSATGSGGTVQDRFANVPPIQPFPRMGYFGITPTSPGYYSLVDVLEGRYREEPPKHPHPRFGLFPFSFFDVNWKFLDDPNNTDTDYADVLKRQRFCDDLCMITTGGEVRARFNYEANSRLLNVGPDAGRDNTYDLYRTRIYADLYVTQYFRMFAEFFAAFAPNYTLPPIPPDRDVADFLNLFIDAQVGTVQESPVWFRLGRQELLYGSQRLISPLEWVNTRRTFQGGKLFWLKDKNSFDLFCVQPVLQDHERFNSVDNNVLFTGAWYTHRPRAGSFIDAYYLFLDDTNPFFEGGNGVRGGKSVHTVGGRWCGDKDNWLWDFEAMVQFGEYVNQGLFANAFTAAFGYHFKDCDMTPIIWLSFDHASGTPNPGEGSLNQTFSQLYPFGHYYLGFIDIVGRRNINDISAYLTFWPDKWILAQVQCHNFWLDSPRDALYNAAGLPIRQDKTGVAGNYVGTELDFLVNFHLDNHNDLLISYSYMFAGRFIIETASTPGGRDNPQALYCQYTYRW